MFYIKQASSAEEINSKFWRKFFNLLTIKDNIIILPHKKLTPKNLKTLTQKIINFLNNQEKVCKYICVSNNLLNYKELTNALNAQNITILNGREIFSLLIPDCLEYICTQSDTTLSDHNISIACSSLDNTLKNLIFDTSKKTKNLNIVTNKPKDFQSINKILEKQHGIILHTSNNKKKAFLKSQIIINYNLPIDNFNKFSLPNNAIILNIKNENKSIKKSFNGININYYNITIKESILKTFSQSNLLKDFTVQNLYESLIVENGNFEHKRKLIKNDEVKIINLVGQNNIINKKEYNLLKKH